MADGSKIVLVNRAQNRLQYEKGADSIYLDGRRVALRNQGQKEIIWLLLSSLGKNVHHAEIAARCGTGSNSDEPNTISSKFVAALRKHIGTISELDDLIVSVHSIGYTIGSNWNRPPSGIRIQKSKDFLIMLDSVVADCVLHAERHSVVTCDNGLQYLDFDAGFALQKYEVLNVMLWDTIRILSSGIGASAVVTPGFKHNAHHTDGARSGSLRGRGS